MYVRTMTVCAARSISVLTVGILVDALFLGFPDEQFAGVEFVANGGPQFGRYPAGLARGAA